jgi:hypothetical protein
MKIEIELLRVNILETPTNAIECKNVILLNSNHRHVLDTHVAIFRGGKKKNTITIILYSFSYHPAMVRPIV